MSNETHYVFKKPIKTNDKAGSTHEIITSLMPARMFFFSVYETVGKDGFLVRKVYSSIDDPYLLQKNLPPLQRVIEVFPEEFGITPKSINAGTSVAEHVMGNNMSKFTSTSLIYPSGSPRFMGKTVFIDVNQAIKNGSKVIDTKEILKALENYKSQYPHKAKRINQIAGYVDKIDKEALLAGKVPAKAVFNERSLAVTKGMMQAGRVVQVFGIGFTAYDLSKASKKSLETGSMKPISAEVVRQAGGWGSAVAGMKIGAATGAALGVETGPGALLTGLVGGIVFGAAGYYGADWVADFIDEN